MIADTALGERRDSGIAMIRLHGDCHPGNILWTPDEGPHFVDLDDARTGPAVQDLWMLLSGDRGAAPAAAGRRWSTATSMFREFDRDELALIEPLRTLRLIHYSAWLARRWDDPIFPINFPWFGTSDYWQGQVQMLEEQIEAMAEPPLVVYLNGCIVSMRASAYRRTRGVALTVFMGKTLFAERLVYVAC